MALFFKGGNRVRRYRHGPKCQKHPVANAAIYINVVASFEQQEAQLSPSDRAMRLVSSNLASCNATVQKLLIRQVLTKLVV